MSRVYSAKELQRLRKIKDAVIKVNAEKKVETRRKIEDIEHAKRAENNSNNGDLLK